MATSHAKRVQPKKSKAPAGLVGHLPVLTSQEVFRTSIAAAAPSPNIAGGHQQQQRHSPSPNAMGHHQQHNNRHPQHHRSATPTTTTSVGQQQRALAPLGASPQLLNSSQAQLVESIYPQSHGSGQLSTTTGGGSSMMKAGGGGVNPKRLTAGKASPIVMEIYNPGADRPLALPSSTAPSSIMAQHATAEANTYIKTELSILTTEGGGPMGNSSGATSSHERLGVFKTAFRMVMPVMAPPVAEMMERIIGEHDRFMREVERRHSENSMHAERKRLEHHYQQHYLDAADAKERDLEQRKKEVNQTESTLLGKFRGLENQVAALKEENAKLRSQQNEDHDRIINMAQAVVDSRLSSQKAEIASREMEEENDRIKKAGQQHVDLVQDNMDMVTILKSRNIAFEPRCKFVIDAMMGKGK